MVVEEKAPLTQGDVTMRKVVAPGEGGVLATRERVPVTTTQPVTVMAADEGLRVPIMYSSAPLTARPPETTRGLATTVVVLAETTSEGTAHAPFTQVACGRGMGGGGQKIGNVDGTCGRRG